jgi:uncharacterized protein (UPF0332 family)
MDGLDGLLHCLVGAFDVDRVNLEVIGAGFYAMISRAYYAMFYAARAILIRDRVPVGSKHSAVVATFGREYAKSGKIEPRYHRMLIEDFEWRQKADYDVFWHADRETAQGRVADAREFVSLVSKMFL